MRKTGAGLLSLRKELDSVSLPRTQGRGGALAGGANGSLFLFSKVWARGPHMTGRSRAQGSIKPKAAQTTAFKGRHAEEASTPKVSSFPLYRWGN